MSNKKYKQEFAKSKSQDNEKSAQSRAPSEHSAVQNKRADAYRNEQGASTLNKQNQMGQQGQYPTHRSFNDEE